MSIYFEYSNTLLIVPKALLFQTQKAQKLFLFRQFIIIIIFDLSHSGLTKFACERDSELSLNNH